MQQEDLKLEREKRLEQWNSFVDFGILLPGVNPMIAQSWIRSKAYGINPRNPQVYHLPDAELEKLRKKNRDMIRFAQPLMDKLLSLEKDTVNVMSLHDKNGYMLAIAHHDTPQGNWRENIFCPGVRWTEADVGTNGVGLALHMDEPVQIFGAEHYSYMQREIICSAAPIHNTDGTLIGVLNVSGPFSAVDSHLLALVAYGAYSIESQINLLHSYEFINKTMDVISEGLLLFNNQFVISRCSRYAAKIFKTTPSSIVGKTLAEVLDIQDIRDRILSHLDRMYTIQEKSCRVGDKTIACNVSIMPMTNDDEFLGGTLLLKESKSMNKIANLYAGNYSRYTFDDIITGDERIKSIIESMKRAAETDCGILIEGESGTGKELFAHAIHSCSLRRNEPFIAINCASLPRSLVESELFGYEKGAFSGALNSGNPGKFELANGGTLFLDEIGELPLEIQPKLLRVLDTHRVARLGGKTEKELNIRIIAATNRNLLEEVRNQNFREDLYYRLNIFKFNIPPLRERKNDVALLATTFIERQNLKEDSLPKQASPEFLQLLQDHCWPGNVRELQNIVVRSYCCCPGQVILPEHMGGSVHTTSHAAQPQASSPGSSEQARPVLRGNEAFEQERLLTLIEANGGDLMRTAEALGISRATMYRRLNKYRINTKSLKPEKT